MNNKAAQGDLFEARSRRARALRQVVDHAGSDFVEGVRRVVAALEPGEYTGEDIRMACGAHGVVAHDPHAWGGVVDGLRKAGLLHATGEWRPMRGPKSNARRTPVYLIARG